MAWTADQWRGILESRKATLSRLESKGAHAVYVAREQHLVDLARARLARAVLTAGGGA